MDAFEDYLPLWLELHFDDQAWLFELRAGEERAVVVGSHPTADVSIARDGIASTHFHFERERGGVVIVPGYRAALVVDQVPAPEPVAITKTAQVEFCGLLIEATVHDVPPLDMLLQARHGTDRMMRRPDYFERLPEDTDPTVVALAAAVPPIPPGEGAPESDDDIDMMTTTAWRASAPSSTPVGPQGTLIIQRPQTTSDAAPAPDSPKTPSLPPIAPTARIRLEPWTSHDAVSPQSSPTRVEVPRPRGSVPPARTLDAPALPVTPAAESASMHSLAPMERAVAPVTKRVSAVAQLGMAASRHPFRVALAALPICAVLALAFVGAARLAGRYPAATSSATRPAAGRSTVSGGVQLMRPTDAGAGQAPSHKVSKTQELIGLLPPPSAANQAGLVPSASVASSRNTRQRAPRSSKPVFLTK